MADAMTQNAWFRCGLCAAISGEISILIQTRAESWGRFLVPRICRWESKINQETVNLAVAMGRKSPLDDECLKGLKYIEFFNTRDTIENYFF